MISSVFLVGTAWRAPVGSTIVRHSTLVMSASQDLAAERYWLDQDEIVTLPPPDVAEAAEQVGRLLELGHGLSPPKRVVIKRDRMPNALTISLAFVFAAPAALVSTIHLVLAPPLASVATSARARVATFLATLGVELGRPRALPLALLLPPVCRPFCRGRLCADHGRGSPGGVWTHAALQPPCPRASRWRQAGVT